MANLDDPETRAVASGGTAREGGRLEELLKQAVALSGLCYVFGFLTLNSSLGNLGIYDFSIVSSRVVAAGVLYLALCLLSGVGWFGVVQVSFATQPVSDWSKKRLYGTLGWGWIAGSGFGIAFYSALWAWLYGHRLSELGAAAVLWALCNSAAQVLLVAGGLYSATGKGGLIWPALGMVLLVVALSLFGSALYSKVPGRLGGGQPLRVQLLVKPQSGAFLAQFGLPSRILPVPGGKPEGASVLTAPVDLVLSGSETYILRTVSSPPRALVLAKDNVQGIAYLP